MPTLIDEIRSFSNIWKKGYYEGDPLDPLSRSTYGRLGYMSILHAVYLGCIRPYVKANTVALEIGPGRGAWTKVLLGAREVWALDAKSREDNRIDEYLGCPKNLFYHQVRDFSCRELPDDYFTYMFSFGCFCHISWEGTETYAANLFPKLKSGATCFWMIADYEQRNRLAGLFDRYDIVRQILPPSFFRPMEWLNRISKYRLLGRPSLEVLAQHQSTGTSERGRWHHSGRERTAVMLERIGFRVISRDVGFALRDPILHFEKP